MLYTPWRGPGRLSGEFHHSEHYPTCFINLNSHALSCVGCRLSVSQSSGFKARVNEITMCTRCVTGDTRNRYGDTRNKILYATRRETETRETRDTRSSEMYIHTVNHSATRLKLRARGRTKTYKQHAACRSSHATLGSAGESVYIDPKSKSQRVTRGIVLTRWAPPARPHPRKNSRPAHR